MPLFVWVLAARACLHSTPVSMGVKARISPLVKQLAAQQALDLSPIESLHVRWRMCGHRCELAPDERPRRMLLHASACDHKA